LPHDKRVSAACEGLLRNDTEATAVENRCAMDHRGPQPVENCCAMAHEGPQPVEGRCAMDHERPQPAENRCAVDHEDPQPAEAGCAKDNLSIVDNHPIYPNSVATMNATTLPGIAFDQRQYTPAEMFDLFGQIEALFPAALTAAAGDATLRQVTFPFFCGPGHRRQMFGTDRIQPIHRCDPSGGSGTGQSLDGIEREIEAKLRLRDLNWRAAAGAAQSAHQ